MKKLLTTLVLASAIALGTISAAEKSTSTATPRTVIHFITVAFKKDTPAEQIEAALEAARKLPASYPGILHVWAKPLKVQNLAEAKIKKTHVIAMEFASEQALKDYADSDAQLAWYKLYEPIREQSTTFDVTN
jgi:hypothetical protein